MPSTGLDTPITNIVHSEASPAVTQVSDGLPGHIAALAIEENAVIETIPRIIAESFLESAEITQQVPDISGLVDIGAASFGMPPLLEAVIGTDERIRVPDTEKFPWCSIASLLITGADNSQWIGTGWFISPRTLVTAGHCVYIKNSDVEGRDGWVKKIQVIPGRNGEKVPYGGITATEFWTVRGWGDDGLESHDYGAVILPGAFPQDPGSFSFGVFTDEELLAATANVAGYPSDKQKGTLGYDNRIVGSVKPEKVFYAADTAGGQSGSAVYMIRGQKRIAIAIHTYGGATANSGTRITAPAFANLVSWKKD